MRPIFEDQGPYVCVRACLGGVRSLARAITGNPTTFSSGRGVVSNSGRKSGNLKAVFEWWLEVRPYN